MANRAEVKRLREQLAKLELLALREDKARLDWLEKQRMALNAHTGSRYGWKLVQSHLVNRLMLPTPEVCEMAGVDLHDTGLTSDDVRAAIDRVRTRS